MHLLGKAKDRLAAEDKVDPPLGFEPRAAGPPVKPEIQGRTAYRFDCQSTASPEYHLPTLRASDYDKIGNLQDQPIGALNTPLPGTCALVGADNFGR